MSKSHNKRKEQIAARKARTGQKGIVNRVQCVLEPELVYGIALFHATFLEQLQGKNEWTRGEVETMLMNSDSSLIPMACNICKNRCDTWHETLGKHKETTA